MDWGGPPICPMFFLRLRRRRSPWFDLVHHRLYFSSPHPTPGSALFSGTVCPPLLGLFTYLFSASFQWTSVSLSLGLYSSLSLSLSSLILYHYSHYLSLSASLSGSLSPLFGILFPYLESLHHSISFSVPSLRAFNLNLKRIVAHWSLSLRRVKLGGGSLGVLDVWGRRELSAGQKLDFPKDVG